MHEFETIDLEFCPAEPMRGLRDIRELQNPVLERFAQPNLDRTENSR